MTVLGIAMPHRIPPCVLPIAAAGVSSGALAMADWRTITSNATAAIGLAGLVGGSVVGGVIYAIRQWDNVKIERQKRWDDANKDSLSKQIEDMRQQHEAASAATIENQERMRESLHTLRDDAQQAQIENANLRADLATLRKQFMDVSRQLRETDLLLHAAREEMHANLIKLQQTADALAESEREHAASERARDGLRAELDGLRKAQSGQGDRLARLEQVGSGDSIPIPGELHDPAARVARGEGLR